jgi:hypothetical protein
VTVTDDSQGLVNNPVSNQKVIGHPGKVGRISGMTVHKSIAKHVSADLLNKNNQNVTINTTFIAGSQVIFAKIIRLS